MRIHRAFLILGLTLPLLVGNPATAPAATTPEARSLALVNAERSERGLSKLVRTTKLDALAERHARVMRDRGQLFHTQDLAGIIPGSWRFAGENVGYGGAVRRVHVAFMGSPAHRENILRPRWDQVGIGIVWGSDGRLWETQIFVDR